MKPAMKSATDLQFKWLKIYLTFLDQPKWTGQKCNAVCFTYQAIDASGISVICVVVQVYCNDIGQYVGLKHLYSARGWLACFPEIIWIPTNDDELVVGVVESTPVSLVEEGGERSKET